MSTAFYVTCPDELEELERELRKERIRVRRTGETLVVTGVGVVELDTLLRPFEGVSAVLVCR